MILIRDYFHIMSQRSSILKDMEVVTKKKNLQIFYRNLFLQSLYRVFNVILIDSPSFFHLV